MPNQKTRQRRAAASKPEDEVEEEEPVATTPTVTVEKKEERQTGVCRWYKESRKYGFISSNDGTDIFVHAMDIEDEISEGDTLEYSVVEYNGRPKAIQVCRVNGRRPEPPQEEPTGLVDDLRRRGTTAWYTAKKKHGFIKPDEAGPDIFVHALDLRDGALINEGDRVEYNVAHYNGKIKAVDVVKLNDTAAPLPAAKPPPPPPPPPPTQPAKTANGQKLAPRPWPKPEASSSGQSSNKSQPKPSVWPKPDQKKPASASASASVEAPAPAAAAPAPAPAPAKPDDEATST